MKMVAIGIDLGTTHSCVGVSHNGKVEIIHNEQGSYITPSCVAFTDSQRLIGTAAKNQAAMNPENTIFDAKRLIGRKYDDEHTQEDIKLWPFTVVNENGNPKIQVVYKGERKTYAPEEISSMVLSKMKDMAEIYLKEVVHDAVITVPAYFNNAQRDATKDAGRIAGFNVLGIISEPTAAALAYGLNKINESKSNILIFDLGGGTFDVSILTLEKGTSFEVKATSGDTHLGGEDFDNRLVKYFLEEFKRKFKKDASGNKRSVGRLRREVEKAKRILSCSILANLDIDAFFDGIDYQTEISRVRFEDLCSDLFESTLKPVKNALKDAKMEKSDIDKVVLVGGSTRILKIQSLLQDFFCGKSLTIDINADEAVACGAAAYAEMLRDGRKCNLFTLRDVTPLSLGIETNGSEMTIIIPRNSQIPCRMNLTTTTKHDKQASVMFSIYEGERSLTRHNNHLGKFILSGILPAPAGEPTLEVSLELDTNGILNAQVIDVDTGNSSNVVIKMDNGRFSKNEIEKMIHEAEKFKEEDAIEKSRLAASSELESYIFKAKEVLATNCNNLSHSEKLAMLTRCDETLIWLEYNFEAKENEYRCKLLEMQAIYQPFIVNLKINIS